jgi:hypothetical protein
MIRLLISSVRPADDTKETFRQLRLSKLIIDVTNHQFDVSLRNIKTSWCHKVHSPGRCLPEKGPCVQPQRQSAINDQSWPRRMDRGSSTVSKAGVPEEIEFRTKGQIAGEQIERALADNIPRGIVLADAGYGTESDFRDCRAARNRKRNFCGRLAGHDRPEKCARYSGFRSTP